MGRAHFGITASRLYGRQLELMPQMEADMLDAAIDEVLGELVKWRLKWIRGPCKITWSPKRGVTWMHLTSLVWY